MLAFPGQIRTQSINSKNSVVNIDVKELSTVDRELTIKAGKEDLAPKFDQAVREYRKKINLPGFRPGQVPASIIKKRFGKDIEGEQINAYIQEVFEKNIVPEHKPVGEPVIDKVSYENGELEVHMKIGVKPEFEVMEIEKISVDKMVHDVSEEEVDEELERTRQKNAKFEDTDEAVSAESKVVLNAQALDKDGNPIEGDTDEGKEVDLSQEDNKPFLTALEGKKVGDEATVTFGEGDDTESFQVTITSVQKKNVPELNDDFVNDISKGTYTELSNYRSFIKSQIQSYYDETAENLVKQNIMDELVKNHEFEIPEVVVNRFLEAYLEQTKQQYGEQYPEGFNEESFREENLDQAKKEAKWAFILGELEERYAGEVELKPEDVDNHLTKEAARYGLPMEMIKNFYAQSGDQLENLRRNIRTDKLFGKLAELVSVNELTKDEYQKKYNDKDSE